MSAFNLRYCLVGCIAIAGCSTSSGSTTSPDAPASVACTPSDATAPTYSQLYTNYFAVGTPGHCATAGCHAAGSANFWSCGSTAEMCYQGMVGIGLVSKTDPTASLIASSSGSPLVWINPNGIMPADATKVPNAQGAADIKRWVADCAQDN